MPLKNIMTTPRPIKKSAWYYRLSTPKFFVPFADTVIPWIYSLSALLLCTGFFFGLLASPVDYQQGNTVRIMYIHVPAAMLSSGLYVFMAILSAIFFIWRIKLAVIIARSTAIVGAIMTLIVLTTGAIWGRPTWGTWWEWDMRLTSSLIMFFLYIGYIALDAAFEDRTKADRAISLLALIGIINVPLIKLSVYFFNTLHQKSTLFAAGKPSISTDMLIPLLIMIAAVAFFCMANIMRRAVNHILATRLETELLRKENNYE